MADLSDTPLTLMPLPDDAVRPLSPKPAGLPEPFPWPTPALASYPGPVCAIEAERCEVEGLNGRILPGRLMQLRPGRRRDQLLTPHARTPMCWASASSAH